jgi:hypothetical protein
MSLSGDQTSDVDYSKKDVFTRNKSGGRYCIVGARFTEKLGNALFFKMGMLDASGYKTMFFTKWLWGAFKTAS